MTGINVNIVVAPGERCEVFNGRTKKWEGGTVRMVRINIHPDGEQWVQYEVELHRRSKRTNIIILTVYEAYIREEQD